MISASIRNTFHQFLTQAPRLRNNPIILREFITRIRKPTSFILLTVLLSFSAMLCLSIWHAIQTQQFASSLYGQHFVSQIMSCIYLFILFWAPLAGAVSIIQEKEQGSWELLRTTPTNTASVLIAKLISPMLMLWIMIISMLPFISLSFPIGGVSGSELMLLYYTYSQHTLFCVSLGIYCSSIARSSINAIAMAYFWVFFIAFAPIIFILVVRFDTLLILDPQFLYYLKINGPSFDVRFLPNWMAPYVAWIHVGIYWSMIILLLAASARRLTDSRAGSESKWKSFFIKRTWGNGKKITINTPYPDSGNPVLIRELRLRLVHNRFGLLVSLIVFSLLGFLMAVGRNEMRFGDGTFSILALTAVPFMILPGAVSALRQERDLGLWDSLLTTELKHWQILNGKILVNFIPFALRFACLISLWMIFVYYLHEDANRTYYQALWAMPLVAASIAFLLQSLGMFLSLRCDNTVTAYGIAFLIVGAIYLGGYIFGAITMYPLGQDTNSPWLGIQATASPLFLYLTGSTPGFWGRELIYDEWRVYMMLQVAWMLSASVALYWLTLNAMQREIANQRL